MSGEIVEPRLALNQYDQKTYSSTNYSFGSRSEDSAPLVPVNFLPFERQNKDDFNKNFMDLNRENLKQLKNNIEFLFKGAKYKNFILFHFRINHFKDIFYNEPIEEFRSDLAELENPTYCFVQTLDLSSLNSTHSLV